MVGLLFEFPYHHTSGTALSSTERHRSARALAASQAASQAPGAPFDCVIPDQYATNCSFETLRRSSIGSRVNFRVVVSSGREPMAGFSRSMLTLDVAAQQADGRPTTSFWGRRRTSA
jgi:hypothetical protein